MEERGSNRRSSRGKIMFRRNLFALVVLIALILSAAFTSWTQDTSGVDNKSMPPVSSSPPDLTNYSRPATPGDLAVSKAGFSTGGASVTPVVVEVPNSAGGEPDIAINPLNLNQIVIHQGFGGWNGNAPNFVSNDGGLTWTQANQIPPPPGIINTGGPSDITHDYGMDGNLYGAYLTGVGTGPCAAKFDVFSASNTTPTTGGLFSYFTAGLVAQLTNFGGTEGCADQPWLLTNVDPTTPGQTNTYVGYDDDSGNNVRVSAALGTQPPNFVTDKVSGVTFGGGINQGHRIAVDPRTGAIYSLYQGCFANCGGSPKGIAYVLNRSLNAGTTWKLNGSATGITAATGFTVQPTPKFGTVNALLGGIDHVAVDPTTSDVYVVFGAANGSPSQGIFIVKITFDNSSPSNAIIGAAHAVSPSGVEAALPSVAVAANGTVGVLYTSFDSFDVNGFPIFSGHFASSTDGGVTFTDQTLLTFLSTVKDDGTPRQRFLGDYQQLKVVNDLPLANAGATFYGVFTGNGAALGDPVANNQAIFFKVVAAPQINLNQNPISIGNVCEGSTGQAQLEVSNTGPDNLIISSITRTSGSPDISLATGPTFPVNISPDANFNFTFSCKPTSVGVKTATFNIASNDPANPKTVVTATCNGASASLTVPAGLTFPPTVIQQDGACPAKIGVPVTNSSTCPAQITAVTLTQTSSPADYSLTGVPGLPVNLEVGDQLGAGDLDLVFEPFTLARTSTGTVNVTFVNDPITGATTTDRVPFCGEAVQRGLRVLVTLGGVPVSTVKRINLQTAFGPEQPNGNFFTHQTIKNAPLQTVTGTLPCPTFSFHAEFGGITNPRQLKDGEYRLKVEIQVGKKTKTKVVRVNMDECTFTPNVVVAF